MSEDFNKANETQDYKIVDEALYSLPAVTAPPTLLPAILAQIQPRIAPPRFRLEWLDYAISFFAACFVGFGLLIWRVLPLPIIEALPTSLSTMLAVPPPSIVWLIFLGTVGALLIALPVTVTILAWSRSPLER